MLCDSCKDKEATVHITKVINGVKTEGHYCDECARQKQKDLNIVSPFSLGVPLSIQNILDGFFEVSNFAKESRKPPAECPVCRMKFDEFRSKGRLGCGNCYKEFNSEITPLIRRVHGNIQHVGKVPRRTGGILKIKRDILKLKDELRLAVQSEEYEKAAKLRDEIRELEANINNDNKE